MITNVSRIVSPDLFVENDSLLFDRQRALQYASVIPSLGAITFVARKAEMSCGLEDLAIASGNEATTLIKQKTQEGLGFWLFVCEKFEAPPTQEARLREHEISKYRKVWYEHVHLIDSSAIINTGDEIAIQSGAFVFLAGLLDVRHSIPEAINAVRTHPAYSMIVSNREGLGLPESIYSIFSFSFPQAVDIAQMRVNWLSLALGLCTRGDILLRVSGLFDDPEAAVDIIGSRETILSL